MKLPVFITNRIARRMSKRLVTRADVVIGGSKNPYLLRWYIIPRNRFANIYLHLILRSDDDRAPHTHPWHSLSLMLDGAMGEWRRLKNGSDAYRTISKGELVWRGPNYAHRLVIENGYALTIFFTGPKIAEWFFLCPRGPVHWKAFTAPHDHGQVGRGCDP